MSSFILKDGKTPDNHDVNLCLTCREALVTRGYKQSEIRINCGVGMIPLPMTFAVSSCSSYDSKSTPSIHHYEKIAWRVSPDFKRNPAGFSPEAKIMLSPANYAKKHKSEDDD